MRPPQDRRHDEATGRVVWINSCFSSGKPTVAELLVHRLGDAFLLDPEVIGGVLRDRLVPPPAYPGDFQDLELWRRFTREAVVDAAERYRGTVVVPMCVFRHDYFDEIVAGVRNSVRLDHFTLVASRETILEREARRKDETGHWGVNMVDRVLPALANGRFAVHVDAETRPPTEVTDEISNQL